MKLAVQLEHPEISMRFTNRKWQETVAECEQTNTKPEDRPDICNKVFAMNIKEDMRYVKETKLFGKVAGEVKVIEFQKRGLEPAPVLSSQDTASRNRLASPDEID